jgi:hypothetical protein
VNHEPENHLSPSDIPSHCSSDPAGPTPEALQDATSEHTPFFATEDAFLQAIYDKWEYFIRYLLKHYHWLFEQERETGSRAPVNAGWYVPIMVPKAHRTFDALVGSCDVQDVLVDAIERCLNSENASHYTHYTPLHEGKPVTFTTWFLYPLRSCVGARVKARTCRRRYEQPETEPAVTPWTVALLLAQNTAVCLDHSPTGAMYMADTLVAHYGALRESLGFPLPPPTPRRPHGDPLHETREDSMGEVQLTITQLAAYVTHEEREILRHYLSFGSASRAFAHAIGYEYSQARTKISSIMKKMRKNLIKIKDNATNMSLR